LPTDASTPSISSLIDDMAEDGPVGTEGASFEAYIYGSITLDNPPLPNAPPDKGATASAKGGEQPINILQVRKKKRPAASS